MLTGCFWHSFSMNSQRHKFAIVEFYLAFITLAMLIVLRYANSFMSDFCVRRVSKNLNVHSSEWPTLKVFNGLRTMT